MKTARFPASPHPIPEIEARGIPGHSRCCQTACRTRVPKGKYSAVPFSVVAKRTLFPTIGPGGPMSKKPVESTTLNDFVLVRAAIDLKGPEGKTTEPHLLGRAKDPRQAHLVDVRTEKADQSCSTSWLPQCGQVTSPSSQSTRAKILEKVFLQARQKNS